MTRMKKCNPINSQQRRNKRLLFAKAAFAAAATTTATLTSLVTASNAPQPPVAVDDATLPTDDGGQHQHHFKKQQQQQRKKNHERITKSTMQELVHLSTLLKTIHESKAWSSDSLDIIGSLQDTLADGDDDDGEVIQTRDWMDERERAVRKLWEEKEGRRLHPNKEMKVPATISHRRQLLTITEDEISSEMKENRSSTNLRRGRGSGGVQNYNEENQYTEQRNLGRGVVLRRGDRPAWKGGWVEDEHEYEEECFDIEDLERGVWISSGSGDTDDDGHWYDDGDDYYYHDDDGDDGASVYARAVDYGNYGRGDGGRWSGQESDRQPGKKNRNLRRTYYYAPWNGGGGYDSKTAKQSKTGGGKGGKYDNHYNMWQPPPPRWSAPSYTRWSAPSWDSSNWRPSHPGRPSDDPNEQQQQQIVVVMEAPGGGGKAGKTAKAEGGMDTKTAKTKTQQLCFIKRNGDEGEGFCGMSLADAGRQCAIKCEADGDCPGGQSCFGGVTGCRDDDSYCGMDFQDASSQCDIECDTGADCPRGEYCFVGVNACGHNDSYCGSSLIDAGAQCAIRCDSAEDCPGSQSCYDGVGECSPYSDRFCGVNFDDASSQCAIKCTNDGDDGALSCPMGESCWGGVSACPDDDNSFCGTDLNNASSQCSIRCGSADDCPQGQSCFNGVTCLNPRPPTPQPTGRGPSPPSPTPPSPPSPPSPLPPTPKPSPRQGPTPPAPECSEGCLDCDLYSPLPCPRSDLKRVCDKHNEELHPPGTPKAGQRVANFADCYDMCKPSFCCIHDSLSENISPSCSQEYANCPLYYPCYIIWWKLHDTIGPATYMRVEQAEPFFEDLKFEYLEQDFGQDTEFFLQLFGHHFDGDDVPTDDTFENPDNW